MIAVPVPGAVATDQTSGPITRTGALLQVRNGRAGLPQAALLSAFGQIAEGVLPPLAIFDLEGRILYANPAYAGMMRFETLSEEDLAEQARLLGEEAVAMVADIAGSGQTRLGARRVVNDQAGVERHFTVSFFPLLSQDRRFVAVGALHTDVTDRVQTVERLRETQNRFTDIVRSTSDWVWETDATGALTYLSDRVTELTGVPSAALLGRSLLDLGHFARTGEARLALATVLGDRTPFRSLRFDILHRQGQLRHHRLSGVPAYSANGGTFLGFRGTGHDVSDEEEAKQTATLSQRELERALADLELRNAELALALERAQAATRAKDAFLANMSHELRTPLNAIIGYGEVIGSGLFGKDVARIAECGAHIRAAGTSLLDVLSGILDYSGLSAGAPVHPGVVRALTTLLDAAFAPFEAKGRARGLDLSAVRVDPAIRVQVDPDRACGVLGHLLSNAVKFCRPGDRIGIDITPHPRRDGWIELTVWDDGPGIPPERQAVIFESFAYGGEDAYARAHEGLGLGLSIARIQARLLGSDLTVSSTPGKGCRFTFALQLA